MNPLNRFFENLFSFTREGTFVNIVKYDDCVVFYLCPRAVYMYLILCLEIFSGREIQG